MSMKEIGLGKALAMTCRAGRMTPGERKELAQKRLKELAAYAGQNSPYYGRLYKGLPEDWKLTDLPTVNKVDLMAHFDMWLTDRTVTEEAVNSFMEDRENIGRLMDGKYLIFTTSGSTGSPLVVLYDKTCMNISSALSVLRAYARKEDLSAFIKKGKRTASIFAEGFYLGSGSVKYQLRRMPWKKGMMMNLDVRTPTAEIVEKLNRFSPVMLGGYPSGLELLADEQAAGRLHISPAIVMTGGELLRDEVREKLADAFGGYVQTNYSCTEGGTMCHECVNRHLHINDEWIMIEAVDEDNRPVPDGTQSAKILLTNLANKVQPFIRYEVSDRIVMHHEECGCGCDAPWLEIEGRNDDILMFEEGIGSSLWQSMPYSGKCRDLNVSSWFKRNGMCWSLECWHKIQRKFSERRRKSCRATSGIMGCMPLYMRERFCRRYILRAGNSSILLRWGGSEERLTVYVETYEKEDSPDEES